MRRLLWATQILVINEWMCGGWSDPTYRRELACLGYQGVMDLLYGGVLSRTVPEITRSVVLAWRGALTWTGWNRKHTLMTPLWVGTWLAHVAGLEGFAKWDHIGITLLGDIWGPSSLNSFEELQREFGLHRSQFFKYLQLRHALATYGLKRLEEFNPLEVKVLSGKMGRGGVSRLYKSLVIHTPDRFDCLREKWEGLVGDLEEEDWRDASMAHREMAISSRLRLLQWKIFHMAYRTPALLSKMYRGYEARCPKCSGAPADFFHLIWHCPVTQTFWAKVGRTLSGVCGRPIALTPRVGLLGLLFDVGGNRASRRFVGMATLLAKREIARYWMRPVSPSMSEWRAAMDWAAKTEEPIYLARGCPHKHSKIWGMWWDYFGLQSG